MEKILVIDDEPQILLMIAARLKANGYAVVTASSGAQGLKEVKTERPGLIFLDHVMPEMNGAEVLSRLKEDPATKDIPVVMFTADVKRVKVAEFQALGAADCIYKPFLPDELITKVRTILGMRT